MYLSGVYIGQYKVLLELYLRSVPSASDMVYADGRMSMCALVAEWPLAVGVYVSMCVPMGVHPMDGWMCAFI